VRKTEDRIDLVAWRVLAPGGPFELSQRPAKTAGRVFETP